MPPLRDFRLHDGGRALPADLGAARGKPVYKFRAADIPTGDALARAMARAEQVVRAYKVEFAGDFAPPLVIAPRPAMAGLRPFGGAAQVGGGNTPPGGGGGARMVWACTDIGDWKHYGTEYNGALVQQAVQVTSGGSTKALIVHRGSIVVVEQVVLRVELLR